MVMLGTVRMGLAMAVALLCIGCGVSAQQLRHDRPAKNEIVWSGTSGGYRWKWTTADLAAFRPGAVRASFSALGFEKRTNQQLKDEKSDPVDTYLECTIVPLSIVGSLVSYERDYYWEGGAHPSGGIDYVTIDASRPGHRLLLTDLFPDSAIVRAMLADKIVADTLKRNHVADLPKTTAQLVQALKGKSFGGDDNYRYGFEEDLLGRFAFHHIEGDRVAVRLNVSWSSEIYRFSSTQIGLLLPIPARLRAPLQLAADRRQGFLMADAKKLTRGKTTVLFEFGKGLK